MEDIDYCVYHGKARKEEKALEKYRVVLTTYGTVASEFSEGAFVAEKQ